MYGMQTWPALKGSTVSDVLAQQQLLSACGWWRQATDHKLIH